MVHLGSSSTALAFLTNMCAKCKSASPRAIRVKNWRKGISIEEKLDLISQLEKGEQIVAICGNVDRNEGSVYVTLNADSLKEVCLCSKTATFLLE
jgi:hypothetical protein